jgi:hypothetical protein
MSEVLMWTTDADAAFGRLWRRKGLRFGQWRGMIHTLLGLIPSCTSATSWHHMVAPEFALATWFAGLQFAVAAPDIGLPTSLVRHSQPSRKTGACLTTNVSIMEG